VSQRNGGAFRAAVAGSPDPAALRDATIARARELGLHGWARADADGAVRVHAEGEAGALAELTAFLGAAEGVGGNGGVALEAAKREGHEQFAPRGVPAGVFVVQEHRATAHHWDLRLEVDGVMRSWAVPKGPSLDPAVKRLAVQVEDHGMGHNAYEGPNVIVWDRGAYEQGGRVPWPAAIDERGHAVFVLHGEKLNGGFALQRTGGPGGASAKKPQWLLIKRKDDHARPGSDVVAERPESVVTGKPLPRRV
jgi:DNA ligase D-like protein (predicted 3'-phosphoesterase)